MPSWAIHISLAHKLRTKYHFNDEFILGNVLPDTLNSMIMNNKAHKISHQMSHKSLLALLEQRDIKDNPLLIGCYTHLLADKYFNKYTYTNHVKEIDGQKYTIMKDGSLNSHVSPRRLKHQDFYSFGNNLILDQKLGSSIMLTNSILSKIQDLPFTFDEDDLETTIDKINAFINKDITKESTLKMFSNEELEKLYQDCFTYLDKSIQEILEK